MKIVTTYTMLIAALTTQKCAAEMVNLKVTNKTGAPLDIDETTAKLKLIIDEAGR